MHQRLDTSAGNQPGGLQQAVVGGMRLDLGSRFAASCGGGERASAELLAIFVLCRDAAGHPRRVIIPLLVSIFQSSSGLLLYSWSFNARMPALSLAATGLMNFTCSLLAAVQCKPDSLLYCPVPANQPRTVRDWFAS